MIFCLKDFIYFVEVHVSLILLFIKKNYAEIMNLRNLERVLAREEEVKKRAIVHKQVYSGPKIQYLSKDGNPLLSSLHMSSHPFVL